MHGRPLSPALSHRGAREIKTRRSKVEIERWSRLQGEMSREALQAALGLSDRKSFRERYLKPALDYCLIEMTIPDKPNSRMQKYRLTDKGRQWLAQR